MASDNDILLKVQDLKKHFTLSKGSPGSAQWAVGELPVVDGVTFDVRRGETLALLGARGSGKSTLARLVLLLYPPTGGKIYFEGKSLADLRGGAMREVRRKMQIVFQDPYSALNPRLRVGQIIAEPLDVHGLFTGAARAAKIAELLELVGLNPYFEHRSPLEFSGAQRQRIAIARAMSLSPVFLVWDEPESTLDAAGATGLLDLLLELRRRFGLTVLMTTSEAEVTQALADRIAVLRDGKIAEVGEVREMLERNSFISSAPV
ncbi:MAG: ABC transporter ATP-binding protein [Chloroflexi bacterium]|nr:ABC transporter ATP-binding protein [Chloroflexota bacterium]